MARAGTAVFLSIGLAGDYRWGEHSVLIKTRKLSQGSTSHWQWQATGTAPESVWAVATRGGGAVEQPARRGHQGRVGTNLQLPIKL
jgi:hypothetical protein